MTAKRYEFKVGDIRCIALLDGSNPLGREGMEGRYPDIDPEELAQAFANIGQNINEAMNSFNMLLIQTENQNILVDTGNGAAAKPRAGYLLDSLALTDVTPDDIDIVVITHAHGDHIKGILDDDDEFIFPNASYVMGKVEWDYWDERTLHADNDYMRATRHILDCIQDDCRLVRADEEIVPGVCVVDAKGHTPGHLALLIESNGERFLHLADLLHGDIQFERPDWSVHFDSDTSQSVPSRQKLLARAADENITSFFYHLTFPAVGKVRRAGNGFAWEMVSDANAQT